MSGRSLASTTCHCQAQRFAPAFDSNAVNAIQRYIAIPLTGPTGQYDLLTQGTGGRSAAGAINLAAIVTLSGPPGAGRSTSHMNPGTLSGGVPVTWAQNIVWSRQRSGATGGIR